jgi:hypothetical protein
VTDETGLGTARKAIERGEERKDKKWVFTKARERDVSSPLMKMTKFA